MSAYGQVVAKACNVRELPYFPIEGLTRSRFRVALVEYNSTHETRLYSIVKSVIDEGLSYPFESMDSLDEFRSYFLSHRCYVCVSSDGDRSVVGGFYIKPNFPGRSDHLCNAGFVVDKAYRDRGISSFMVPHYLQIARDLGYEASFFNLVYISNQASMKLWEKFGFKAVGRIPKAGRLLGLGYVDAVQYYYDLTTLERSKGLLE